MNYTQCKYILMNMLSRGNWTVYEDEALHMALDLIDIKVKETTIK